MSTRKLRLTFTLSSLRLSGGVKLVIEYANRLADRGHTVSLVVPRESADPSLKQQLFPSVHLCESNMPLPRRAATPIALLRLVLSLAQATPPSDVIIATHTPTVLPVLLASAYQRTSRIWLYMDYPEMFQGRPFERWLLKNAPDWFHGIAAISRPLAREVKSLTRKSITAYIGAGLPHREYMLGQSHRPSKDQQLVLCMTDSRPRKGSADFLKAAEIIHAQQQNVKFVIVSKHPLAIPNSPCYKLYVAPSDEKLVQLYCKSDIFVFPSWQEGLGYPPLEAMACGVPTVLTDSGGVQDYAQDSYNCLLVPPKQPRILADAILRLLSDPQLAHHLAKNGRETAWQYNWSNAVERFESLLMMIVQGR